MGQAAGPQDRGFAFTGLSNGFAACEDPAVLQKICDALVTDNLDLRCPDTIEIVFGRCIINAFYRRSRIKQYLKDGRALRIETVINSPTDLRIGRRLTCLGELQDAGRAINTRLLHTERAGQGRVLAIPVFERIAHPTVDAAGRRATAMRFGDSRASTQPGETGIPSSMAMTCAARSGGTFPYAVSTTAISASLASTTARMLNLS